MALNADNIYLLVLIPVFIIAVIVISAKFVRKDRYAVLSTILRTLTVCLLICSLSGISVFNKAKDVTTLFLADISDSTKNSAVRMADFIEQAQAQKADGDKTAVMLFGGKAVTALNPTNDYETVSLDVKTVNKDNTNIETALKQAVNVFGDSTKKRIVLITDGAETKGDIISVRNTFRNENIQMLVYDISGTVTKEAGIREISLPQYVNINMNYDVNVIIDSIGSQRASLRLYRGTSLAVNETIDLKDGENRFVFTDKADKGGGITYHAEIVPAEDTFYENNSIYGYCYAENLPSVLVVGEGAGARNMTSILNSAQLNVVLVSPNEAPHSYDMLIAYDSVVLADVEYNDLGEEFVSALENFVKYSGGGLIAVGGENSFGPGGYEDTVLEDMLPVEMDIKTQSEDPDLAMIMVIDRSGSMSSGTQGISGIDLAKEAAFRGIQELEEDDMVGVIAFDSQGQWIVELDKIGGNIDTIKESIGTIQAGGGTSILPALRMACSKLAETDTKIKHIILLTDGQAETEGYSNLMNMARNDGITISTIAVGQGADTKLLQYIAEEGRGRYYYADQFTSLPEIFVYETTVASKDYINNEDFYPSAVDSSEITENVDSVPMLHGYVSTSAKPRADVVLQSDREEPVLAVWQYGLGRTAAWTSDMSGQWSDEWISADEGLQIMRNLISYSMRSDILYDIEVKAEASGGTAEVKVKIPVSNSTGVTANIIAEDGREFEADMSQRIPGEYVCTLPIDKEGAYIITVTENFVDKEPNVYNTGFILGYSKEYDTRALDSNGIINELVSYEGIRLITSPDEIYEKAPDDSYAKKDISVHLIILALIFLVLDILLRRFPEAVDKLCILLKKLKPKKRDKKEIKPKEVKETKKANEPVKEAKPVSEPVKKSSSSTLADIKRNRKK